MYEKIKEYLNNIKINILLSIIITFLFFVIDRVFITKEFYINLFFENLLIVFLLVFFGTLLKSNKLRIFFFSFIIFLIYIQLLHIAYYSTLLNSFEIWIFFYQFNEIFKSVGTDTYLSFIPVTLSILILFFLIFFLLRKFKSKLSESIIINIIFAVLIILWPTEIYLKKRNTGLKPQERKHIIRTGLETTFGFIGNVLPNKFLSNNAQLGRIIDTPTPINKNKNNIVLIIGESLNPKHMHLFGYDKKNTPVLDSLFNNNIIIKKYAIAKGVCTYTSLASFFNLTDSIGQSAQIFSQNTSLFKLAKNNNYKTYFISMQSDKSVENIKEVLGLKYIDVFKTAKDIDNKLSNDESIFDSHILDELKNINISTTNNFIVFQQSGSHAEYIDRYPKSFSKFKAKNYKYVKTAHYDNSVYYTDYVLGKVIKYLNNNTNIPTYFIFVSDHSEIVGERNGTFGHCNLFKNVIRVPFIYSQFNDSTKFDYNWNIISHKDISYKIANLLGYDYQYDYSGIAYTREIDINASTGYAIVKYNKDSLISIERK